MKIVKVEDVYFNFWFQLNLLSSNFPLDISFNCFKLPISSGMIPDSFMIAIMSTTCSHAHTHTQTDRRVGRENRWEILRKISH